MTPEAAIENLRHHVEYIAQKWKNEEYNQKIEDSVNVLIDMYNNQSKMVQELQDTKEDYADLEQLYKERTDALGFLLGFNENQLLLNFPSSFVDHRLSISSNKLRLGAFIKEAKMIRTNKWFLKAELKFRTVPPDSPAINQLKDDIRESLIKINSLFDKHLTEDEVLDILEKWESQK